MSNSARACTIPVRDRTYLLNEKTLKAASFFLFPAVLVTFSNLKNKPIDLSIKIDLVLLRSSFYFTRRQLPLSQRSLGKDFAAKEILTLNSFVLLQVSVLCPFFAATSSGLMKNISQSISLGLSLGCSPFPTSSRS